MISEYDQVRLQIEAIDADPEHKLPEGIDAVIKLAKTHWANEMDHDRAKFISGMIWYDRHKRFIDGYPVNLSPIASQEPGGIYVTETGRRYLVEVIQNG